MLVRCKKITVVDSLGDKLPSSIVLEEVSLGYAKSIVLKNTPNLKVLSSLYNTITEEFYIGENVGTNTGLNLQANVENIYREQKSQSNPVLQSIHVENVNWTDYDVNALSWFADRPTCEFKGTIAIKEDHPQGLPRVTWDLKNKFNKKFGVVDNQADANYKGLLLNYTIRAIDFSKLQMKGQFYVETPDNKIDV